MNIRKEFKTIILPIIKGLPLTLLLVMIAFSVTTRMIIYTNSIYQANGAIRIDIQNHSVNANILFNEQKTNGAGHNFLTEVESFKSKMLIEKTLKALPFDISYYRIGKLKKKEIYTDRPFSIQYSSSSTSVFEHPFYLRFIGADQFIFSEHPEFLSKIDTIQFGKIFTNEQLAFSIQKEIECLQQKPTSLQTGDVFSFQLNSIETLSENINASNLFIKPIDKEIQVIKVYYQHEVPEKAAMFVNTFMETYISSCQKRVSQESSQTLSFVDEQLAEIRSKLRTAESRLAGYKAENGIINSKQETDATLKELMQLDLQKVNYNMQEEELTKLFDFLSTGNNLQDFAPNFEALKDPIFRDAYLQAQTYGLQKMDLLLKFTPVSEEIQTIDSKIKNLRTFIHESVKTTLENITRRRISLEKNITDINQAIQTMPNKERQIVVLEREVKLNEQLYNLMMEKRMELAISKSASVVSHQIIDQARVQKKPIWPNKGLIYGVSIFFALLIGILFSFLFHYFFGTIKNKEDLTELIALPIIGNINRCKKNDKNINHSFSNLYTNLEILKQKQASPSKGLMLVMTSFLVNEGKTFSTVHLGKTFAATGKKTLLIDMDFTNKKVHPMLSTNDQNGGLSAIIKGDLSPSNAILKSELKHLDFLPAGRLDNIFAPIIFSQSTIDFIQELKSEYDYILIDTPALNLVVDAVTLMHQSDFNLCILRSGFSKIRKVKMLTAKIEEFQIPNVFAVLNATKTTPLVKDNYTFRSTEILAKWTPNFLIRLFNKNSK